MWSNLTTLLFSRNHNQSVRECVCERSVEMRARSGSVVKRKGRGKGEKFTWWARITYTDVVTGKRHDRQRKAESKTHAKELVHALVAEVDSTGGRSLAT